MKSKLLLLILVCSTSIIFSQSVPQGINYQAVARDQDGKILKDLEINLEVNLYYSDDKIDRHDVYVEKHSANTNALGLFNMVIGQGKATLGQFDQVPWSTGKIWMELSIELGLDHHEVLHNVQLMSVPYALHAATASELTTQDGIDQRRTETFWSLFGNKDTHPPKTKLGTIDNMDLNIVTNDSERLRIKNYGDVWLHHNLIVGQNVRAKNFMGNGSYLSNIDKDPTNEFNLDLNLVGNELRLTDNGGTLTTNLQNLINDDDPDPTNELNTDLNLVGNELKLTDNGGTLTANLQNLIDDADADPTNELNTSLNLVGNELRLTDNGGTLTANLQNLIDDADPDPTNEFNTDLSIVDNEIRLTDGGGTLSANLTGLVDDADPDPTNELNAGLNLVGHELRITDPGGTLTTNLQSLVDDLDADPTNEIQTIVSADEGNLIQSGTHGGALLRAEDLPEPERSWLSDLMLINTLCSCPSLPDDMLQSLLENGYDVDELLEYGVPPCELLDIGYTTNDLFLIGVAVSDLLECRTPLELHLDGIPLSELYGQSYEGGLLFYLDIMDDFSWEGLVAAPSNYNSLVTWGCAGHILDALSHALGDGQDNTEKILNDQCNSILTLKDAVLSYRSNSYYQDWFVPTSEEFQHILDNLMSNGLGNFNTNYHYWLSTEDDYFNGFFAYFYDPESNGYFAQLKQEIKTVRFIRSY